MAYSKSQTAKSLGISTSELEKRAKSAGYKDTESYAASIGKAVGSSGNYSTDAINTAQQMANLYSKQVEPVVQGLQAEAEPLKARYQNLINQIKGNQQVAENRTTLTTGNELAKRGILNSSGLYQNTMTEALNPVTKDYTGMIGNANTDQESALKSLATQIAQIRSGATTTGLNSGLSAYNAQQNADLAKQQLSANIANSNATLDLANKKYQNIELPESRYVINKPYYQPTSSGSGLDIAGSYAAWLEQQGVKK